ncbi:hypothetical protein [Costertonia aggregata]|uniref:DUF1772 domain-containing protein n=1 Tax=Costertonia aggregata TaxID=343403 RepID=A0A7H9ATE1_9FLAO|nr:hypothetical protein [Costertonia aggregata]QLG46738.1 hypothetical protein HYG79_15725 [Costertonia aggregata]
MHIEFLRLLFDFGLVILIWTVQLIIYPSFPYYGRLDLIEWHKIYVQRISYVVVPLMFGQLVVSAIQVYESQTFYTIASLILVILVWALTFSQFVPLHHKISNTTFTEKDVRQLIVRNWGRTILWNLIFIWGLINLF